LEEGVVVSLGILDSEVVQDLTKGPSSVANVALHSPYLVSEDKAGGNFDCSKIVLLQ